MSSKTTFFALILFSCAYNLKVDGACTEVEQNTEVEKCEKSFVDTMSKNANANCSIELNKIQDCLTELSKKCYPKVQEAVIKQLVDIAMKQFKAVEFYCSTLNNITVKWPNIAPAVQDKLSCSAKVATNQTSYECSKDFREKLHKSPKDSDAIYKSYQESNECLEKETAKHCNKNPSSATIQTAGIGFQVVFLLCTYHLFM